MALSEDPHLAAVWDAEPSTWLAPPAELIDSTKAASQRLFSLTLKYVPKAPLRKLLTDGFDAEQIWQQLEIQEQPLLSSIRRHIRLLEMVSDGDVFGLEGFQADGGDEREKEEKLDGKMKIAQDNLMDTSGGEEENSAGEEENSRDEGGEEEGESVDEEEKAVEDEFLKVKDMERFLEDAEGKHQQGEEAEASEDEMDDVRSEEDEDDEGEEIRYDDFFSKKKEKIVPSKGMDLALTSMKDEEAASDEDEEAESDEDEEAAIEDEEAASDENEEAGNDEDENQIDGRAPSTVKSSYEKQSEKIKKRIEQLEKANLDPKDWTMRGEVTASKRPKNSALEVDLDFEHNVQPAPAITEEVTASIEDLVRGRIIEGRFDDVERKQKLPDMPPPEKKEVDETKSTKGLGEIYEEEYMQSAGLATAPLSESEALRKEASALFKSLCLKLDALSHFHFAPKPVVEEMEVKDNVPALAMEEVAPVSKSDFSMLAPEEVFQGTNELKDDKELTPHERKQRRAAKKRKHSAQQKVINERKKKPRTQDVENGKGPAKALLPKGRTSNYSKSAKVFAELDRVKAEGVTKKGKREEKAVNPSMLKL